MLTFACRRIRWITISGTPRRYRLLQSAGRGPNCWIELFVHSLFFGYLQAIVNETLILGDLIYGLSQWPFCGSHREWQGHVTLVRNRRLLPRL